MCVAFVVLVSKVLEDASRTRYAGGAYGRTCTSCIIAMMRSLYPPDRVPASCSCEAKVEDA